jgi:hypothetical protein
LAAVLAAAACGDGSERPPVVVAATTPAGASAAELAKALGGCPWRAAERAKGGAVHVDYGAIEMSFDEIASWLELDPASAAAAIGDETDPHGTRRLTVLARPLRAAGGEDPGPFTPTVVLLGVGSVDKAAYEWAAANAARVLLAATAGDDGVPVEGLLFVQTPQGTLTVMGECRFENLWQRLSKILRGDEATARFLASIVGLTGPEILARLAEARAAAWPTTTTAPPWRELILAPGEAPAELLDSLDSVGLVLEVPRPWYGHGWVLCAIVYPNGKVAGTGCVDLNDSWLRSGLVCEGVGPNEEPTGPCREIPRRGPTLVVYVPDDGRIELWITDNSSLRPVQRLGEVVLPPERRHDGAWTRVVLGGEMDPATGEVAGATVTLAA